MTEGITPSLDELVALRRAVLGRRPPRRGSHGMSGQAQSPMRGRGMEYAESREYANGDDARHIDWRLTARTGRPHTKLFQAERERLTLIVADTYRYLGHMADDTEIYRTPADTSRKYSSASDVESYSTWLKI